MLGQTSTESSLLKITRTTRNILTNSKDSRLLWSSSVISFLLYGILQRVSLTSTILLQCTHTATKKSSAFSENSHLKNTLVPHFRAVDRFILALQTASLLVSSVGGATALDKQWSRVRIPDKDQFFFKCNVFAKVL